LPILEPRQRARVGPSKSSSSGLSLQDGKVYAGAGYYLNDPVRALMKEGYEITFANPKGNTPQLDVNSAIPQFFGGDEASFKTI